MYSRSKHADIAEAEGKKNLKWKVGGEADKYREDFFGAPAGFGRGAWSWCAAFQRWCAKKAGLDIPVMVPKSQTKFGYSFALVEAWQQWAIFMGFYHDNDGIFVPERGDLVCFDWDQVSINAKDIDWENHIGCHLRMVGKNYECAEGNSANQTAIRTRKPIQIQGWIRIPDGFSFAAGRVVDDGEHETPVVIGEEPTKPALPVLSRVLRNGSKGEDVAELQRLLNKRGANLDDDGKFGDKTEVAVEAFQKRMGLLVDGEVFTATWEALHSGLGPIIITPEQPEVEAPTVAVPMGSAMKRLAADGKTCLMLDISDYQKNVKFDWDAIRKSGVVGVHIKATEGTYHLQKMFKEWAPKIRAAGIAVGFYHFMRPDSSGKAQADWFVKNVRDHFKVGDMKPMMDVEVIKDRNGKAYSGATVVAIARELCAEVEAQLGIRPEIYTGPYFWQALGKTAVGFEKHPLHVAHYGTDKPLTPPPWAKWAVHQYTDSYKGPGITNASGVDASRFNGDEAAFRKLMIG